MSCAKLLQSRYATLNGGSSNNWSSPPAPLVESPAPAAPAGHGSSALDYYKGYRTALLT